MNISTGGVDKALGVHLQKIYKSNSTSGTQRVGRRDALSISNFSALVERGRAHAMSLPDARADRVSQVRKSLELGEMPRTQDVASAMINRAVEGQV